MNDTKVTLRLPAALLDQLRVQAAAVSPATSLNSYLVHCLKESAEYKMYADRVYGKGATQ